MDLIREAAKNVFYSCPDWLIDWVYKMDQDFLDIQYLKHIKSKYASPQIESRKNKKLTCK